MSEVRSLLNQWDPIGVHPDRGGPQDEYHCLESPLIDMVSQGQSAHQISDFLEHQLQHHFGLEPGQASIDQFVRLLCDS